MTLSRFVDEQWMPRVREQCAASTQASYNLVWRNHLQPVLGAIALPEITVPIATDAIRQIFRMSPALSRTSLLHIRAVLSSILTHGIRLGILPSERHVTRYMELPKTTTSKFKGDAYTLEELKQILSVITGQARVAVAIAGYAGLRSAEISGLMWPDYHDGCLWVSRAVWRGIVGETKNAASRAPVPVIAPLAEILDQWRLETSATANPEGYILTSIGGGSVRIDRLVQSSVRPAVEKIPLPWNAMHGFRRSCSSILHHAGVPDVTIAKVLRHANVETTRRHYIKFDDRDLRNAMEALCQR